MRKLVLALGFTVLLNSCGWAQDSAQLFGVWSGTIGKLPITVCLDTNRDYHFGAYYYRAHLKAISLSEKKDDGKSWYEGNSNEDTAPKWQFEKVEANKISGTWISQGKSLPINLKRLDGKLDDGEGGESACGSDLFFSPRITLPKVTETPATLDGQAYVKVTVDAGKQFDVSLETFKLKGVGPKIAAINKILLRDLPQPGKKPDYLQCIQSGLANSGNDGDYSVNSTPIILTPHWLVVSSGDGSFCGGAHPSNSSSEAVYDLRKATQIDLKTWLEPGVADENGKLSGKLESLVESKYSADHKDVPECIESIRSAFGWGLSLSDTGISFTPSLPYVEHVCEEGSVIDFEDVTPFLNGEGKKQLADFRSELPK